MSRSEAREYSANQNAATHFNQNEPEANPSLGRHPDDNVKMDDSDSDDECQAVLVNKWPVINDVTGRRGRALRLLHDLRPFLRVAGRKDGTNLAN